MTSIEGTTGFTGVDIVRWGQDGLAILTSGGNVYLVRGPVVVSGLLGTSTAATLASRPAMTLIHGGGNTLLTLTGTNFQPGVAVTWNGRKWWFVSQKEVSRLADSSLVLPETAERFLVP